MNYGMYLNAAGALVEQTRQEVIANNLANANTVGFKADATVFSARLTEARERNDLRFDVNPVLERIGGGVYLDEVYTTPRNGTYTQSSNPFHVALQGEGYFAVTDGESTFYTRAGNFQRGPDGSLATADGNYRVLNVEGQPLRFEGEGASRIVIDEQGVIWVGDAQAGQLAIAGAPDACAMLKTGDNMYRLRPGAAPAPAPATTSVRQFTLEEAAVNPVMEMVRLIQSYRSFEANMRMLKTQDEVLGRTVNQVGRIA